MRINVTFRHLDPSDALKDYAETRLQKLKKYEEGPMDVNVVLSAEKFRNTAEVMVSGDGFRATAKEEQNDMHSAIDLLSDKIEKQLKKFRDKQRDKKGAVSLSQAAMTGSGETLAANFQSAIYTEKMQTKPMSVEEAIEQLRIKNADFLLFSNSETSAINCIYWRKDGTVGLIEP
jgi:putative sigma-54 modulation protein